MKLLSLFALGFIFLMACAPNTPMPPVATITPNAVAVAQDVAPTIPATATTAPSNTPQPTNTIPPTDTPIPTNTPTNTATATPTKIPTNTPTLTPTEPPTNTPAPTLTATRAPTKLPTKAPTQAPALSPLAAAVNRTDTTSSRFETIAFYSNPFTGFELFRGQGERGPQGAHFFMTGEFCNCLGAANNTIEYLRVGEQLYLKGPVPGFKADQDRWYLVPPDKASTAKSTESKGLLSPGLTEFQSVGDEAIDGVNYHVYTIDKNVARQRLRDVLGFTEQELGKVVNIEVSFWVGDDGYVHQSRTRIDVQSFFNPNSTDIIKFDTRYSDFGIPVQFTKPADAIPLPE
jgi:hypothetical protein